MRYTLLALLSLGALSAQNVSVKVEVPSALKRGTFAQDRFLTVPPGYRVSLVASVSGARFLAAAPNGDILVSNPGTGRVTLLRPDPAGGAPTQFTYASGLKRPHDIVFHTIDGTSYVYISEANQINRFLYRAGDTASHDREIVVKNLPDSSLPELRGSYGHELKNIALDANHKLYVSIGSTCNACSEDTVSDPVRGAVYQYNADGTGRRLFARGLRNAEGLDIQPGTNQLWVAVNNRDDIFYPVQDATGNYGKVLQSYVDDHPAELFTSVHDGGNYGWPFCNPNPSTASGFDRMPYDRDYELNRDGHVDCSAMDTVTKGIQAHSAPLGMKFYRGGAAIALHGSWDRSRKTGYKVIYFPFDTANAQTDLVSGWLDETTQQAWGRPVGIAVDPNGSLLISDDTAGAIYRLSSDAAGISTASGYSTVAPESLASAFGSNFTTETAAASSLPLPQNLGGVAVIVKDSAGVERVAPLLFVSPGQINYQVPSGTAPGQATVSLGAQWFNLSIGSITVANVAPGLYTANKNGTGVAAATAVQQVSGVNVFRNISVFSCNASGGDCMPSPIDVSSTTPVYLSAYGTGFRNRSSLDKVTVTVGGVSVPVLYAGPQPDYPGLDQLNIQLDQPLRGKGEVDVILTVDGQKANPVRISIR
ncbi:MAG: hypothetical protein ABJF23_14645 [Bryobacteraceae bacterium]